MACRSKLEGLVDKLYPLRVNSKTNETVYGKPESSTCDALNEMLTSQSDRFVNDPFVSMFRNRLLNDYHVTVPIFMKFCRWLYKEFSDKTCHKMAQFSPPLPAYYDVKGIETMLTCVSIDADIPAVKCIQVMLQPLDLP